MSLPSEKRRALQGAKDFLFEIATVQVPNIPMAVRIRARDLLRHFPFDREIEDMRFREAAPDAKEPEEMTLPELWHQALVGGDK